MKPERELVSRVPPLDSRAAELGPLFSGLAGALHTGVVLLDREGTPLYVNEAAQAILDLPAPPYGGALPSVLRPTSDGPDALTCDIPVASGTRQVQLRRIPLTSPGDGTLVLLEDRSAVGALEATLALASRIQTRSSLRTQVHDLKAPLNALAINIELLRRGLERDEDLGQKRPEHLGTVDLLQREVARLGRSLDSFLRLTSVEATKVQRRIDLRNVVRSVARLVRPSAKAAGIRLAIELPTHATRVRANGDRIEQALLNLVLNAFEAQVPGGEVRLSAVQAEGGVAIVVEDDGPGIPAHVLPRVFDMNFTTKPGGNGIGLTVARSLVEGEGGRLDLDSAAGRGTRVRIFFPACLDEETTT